MTTKTLETAIKAVDTEVIGRHMIEFYAAAFSDVPDRQGDIIAPGAFDGWPKEFYAGDKPLPVSFTHAAIRESTDPFNIIGWAPPDAEHVFVDEHGLKVRAYLETEINDKAAQVYSLAKRGQISGASLFFEFGMDDQEELRDGPNRGATRINTVRAVREAGPCLMPANTDAYITAVKSDETRQEQLDAWLATVKAGSRAATDDTPWDAGAVMSGDHDAAYYRAVSGIEKTTGEPDQSQHWALPHHKRPGAPANAAAVRNARARFNQTQGLKNAGAARRHIFETHSLPSERAASMTDYTDTGQDGIVVAMKVGRVLSKVNEERIRAAKQQLNDALDEVLALVEVAPVEATEDPEGKAAADDPEGKVEPKSTDALREAIAAEEAAGGGTPDGE